MKKRKLYKYQKQALAWVGQQKKSAFFMEMRLGKTIVAIRWAEQFKLSNILVVSPLSVVPVWQEELFLEGISSIDLTGSWEEKEHLFQSHDVRWFITNPESLHRQIKKKNYPSFIVRYPWDCVAIDESTQIRNPKAIRTKMVCKYFHNISYKTILTGLPNPEGPMDYFQQLFFVYGEFLGYNNFWSFRHGCFHQGWTEWEWLPNSGTLGNIKEEVNKRAFCLTRKQAGVGSRKIYEKRYVTLPPKIRKVYNNLEKDFELDEIRQTKWTIVVKVWLARLTGGRPQESQYCSDHKIKELVSVLLSELKKEQVVIWFRFNDELIDVHTNLLVKNISNDFITGETPPSLRTSTIKRFRKGKFRCLLVQIKCGKFGLDYANSSTAIFYSNSYEYEDRKQAEDRIISPKKKEPVLIMDLLARDTVDEDVHDALQEKGMSTSFFRSKILENLRKRLHGNKKTNQQSRKVTF